MNIEHRTSNIERRIRNPAILQSPIILTFFIFNGSLHFFDFPSVVEIILEFDKEQIPDIDIAGGLFVDFIGTFPAVIYIKY